MKMDSETMGPLDMTCDHGCWTKNVLKFCLVELIIIVIELVQMQ